MKKYFFKGKIFSFTNLKIFKNYYFFYNYKIRALPADKTKHEINEENAASSTKNKRIKRTI